MIADTAKQAGKRSARREDGSPQGQDKTKFGLVHDSRAARPRTINTSLNKADSPPLPYREPLEAVHSAYMPNNTLKIGN